MIRSIAGEFSSPAPRAGSARPASRNSSQQVTTSFGRSRGEESATEVAKLVLRWCAAARRPCQLAQRSAAAQTANFPVTDCVLLCARETTGRDRHDRSSGCMGLEFKTHTHRNLGLAAHALGRFARKICTVIGGIGKGHLAAHLRRIARNIKISLPIPVIDR